MKPPSKIFINYIVFYLLIFLVPLVLFVLFINYQYIDTIDNSYRNELKNVLETTISTIDENFAQLNKTAIEVALNEGINPSNNLPNVEAAQATIKEAYKIKSANSFIDKVILHFNDDQFVYMDSGSAPMYIFSEYLLSKANPSIQLDSMEQIVFKKYFSLDDYKYSIDSNAKKFILFMHALTKYPTRKFGTLLCYINPNAITNMLGERDIIIYDTLGLPIFDSIALRDGSSEYSTPSYTDFHDTTNRAIMFQRQKYYLVKNTSLETGFGYVCLTNITGVERNISKIRWNLLLFCSFISSLAALLIYLAMNKNYGPIQNLINYTNNMIGGHNKNSLDIIKETIETLSYENSTLKTGSAKATSEYVMTLLLKGHFSSRESFESQYASLFKFCADDKFVVCIMLVNDPKMPDVSTLEDIGTRFFNNKFKNTFEKNKYIVIVWSNSITSNNLYTVFKQYQTAVLNELGIETTLGVGTLCDTIENISLSYLNATSALDYKIIKGEGIILYKDISDEKDDIDTLPYKELEELKKKLKQGMTSEVEQILFGILSYIKNCDLSLFLVRGFCFELISAIYQITKSVDVSLMPVNTSFSNYSFLAEYSSIDELADNVKNICHNICELIKTSKEFKHDTQINKMIDYIKSNFTNCDFSVQMMADHFGMSMTNLSQYFKNHTEQNISDCVYYYRIEKAKELLTENLNITDISLMVGYYNVTSFTRRFKQYTGLSPKEYAKQSNNKI